VQIKEIIEYLWPTFRHWVLFCWILLFILAQLTFTAAGDTTGLTIATVGAIYCWNEWQKGDR